MKAIDFSIKMIYNSGGVNFRPGMSWIFYLENRPSE